MTETQARILVTLGFVVPAIAFYFVAGWLGILAVYLIAGLIITMLASEYGFLYKFLIAWLPALWSKPVRKWVIK
jgi:hypothetical protein